MNHDVIKQTCTVSGIPVGEMNPLPGSEHVRLIAFFLPQFHPTPENDQWWGKGFTEWTNVTRAVPLFAGHYQPRLPSDLGFYDLRVREVRHEQIALAKQYGIDGFCYHYYWFSGTRILGRALDDMLVDPRSDMPFCLCWANENWTRRWDGADREILIAQKSLPDDDISFVKSITPFLQDPRYIRLNGAPFLIVYRPQTLPDAAKTAKIWREYCERIGIGQIHLCAALTHGNEDYKQLGFDSGVQFPPHNLESVKTITHLIGFPRQFIGEVFQYAAIAESYLDRTYTHNNVFRTVFPSWDNTARRGPRSYVVLNGTPANYEYWLAESIGRTVKDFPGQDRFVFVNAWNEWAEGCYLEPDRRFQRQYLEATLLAKTRSSAKRGFADTGLPKPQGDYRRSVRGDLTEFVRVHARWLLLSMRGRVFRYPKLNAILYRIIRTAKGLLSIQQESASEEGVPHKYDYSIDLTSDTAPAAVVRMVGQGKRVLDIGAGPGSITRVLIDTNKCKVTAVEVDPEAVKRLIPVCEAVYTTDLNDPAWPEILQDEGRFDVVVAADVLEHLYDPWSALKKMKGLVDDQGYIVVSLPHIGHSAVIACLLDEDFEYGNWGLLDGTHIRFFGMKNIQDLFEKAGLKIMDVHFVVVPPQLTELNHHWRKVPLKIRGVLSTSRFGSVYQVVVKAVPSSADGEGITLDSVLVQGFQQGNGNACASVATDHLSPRVRTRLSQIGTRLGLRRQP